jgi:hypothetical protein
MSIVFFCQSCGARFEVDPGLAGRQAKCRKCGERTSIPGRREAVSVEAAPVPGGFKLTPETSPDRPAAAARRPTVPSWIDAVTSRVALAPLVEDRQPGPGRQQPAMRPSPLDDLGDSRPYTLADPSRKLLPPTTGSKRVSGVKVVWRRELGSVQRILRWLNDAAYLLSVPFIILVLVGGIFKNRPMALLGATVVVLLNASRLATGLFNLVIIPFKDGVIRGILFLVPPFTLIDLYLHWKQLRRPLRRVVEPAITIGLVVLTFIFVPSLRRGGSEPAGLTDRVITGTRDFEEDVSGKVERARNLDLQGIGTNAEGVLRSFSPATGFGGQDRTGHDSSATRTTVPARHRQTGPTR